MVTVSISPIQRRAWLLFVHQLPAKPTVLRVRTWRRLQQLGAVPIKQALYVLPDSADTREDFEWLKAEVEGAGGEASVFSAASIDAWSDDELVEAFRRSAHAAYTSLADDLKTTLHELESKSKKRAGRAPAVGRLLDNFSERLAALQHIDFFGGTGRDRVVSLLDQFEKRAKRKSAPEPTAKPSKAHDQDYHKRLWVTRPRPGVDRMASAWLIRRFIDTDARFGFIADRTEAPKQSVPFDMFGVEFSHHGDHCTFETLVEMFGLRGGSVARLAGIVHDLDLKDGKFSAPEAATVATMIDGLQAMHAADAALLEEGIKLFEGLFRAFDQAGRPSGGG